MPYPSLKWLFLFFYSFPIPLSSLPLISGLPFPGFLSHFANIVLCCTPAGRNSAALSVHIWNPSWEDEGLKAKEGELDYFPYMLLQLIPHFSNKFSYWFLKVSLLVLWVQKCKDRPCEHVSQFQEKSWGKCLQGEKATRKNFVFALTKVRVTLPSLRIVQ